MRAPQPPDPRQPSSLLDVIETTATRDLPFEDPDGSWGTRITRPEGKGWRVSDYSHDKRTRWLRRVPVVVVPQASKVAGRWRRR